MRVLTMKTPVHRCLEAAAHAVHMLAKFPENPRLGDMSRRLDGGAQALEAAELVLEAAERDALRTRIDARYEHYLADQCMRRVKKQVEVQDAHRGGRVASLVFASGTPDVARLQGQKQVDAMRQCELRLADVQDIWPGAAAELALVTEHRTRYENALDAREQGKRAIEEARVNRNTAKERFVQLYAEIASLVKAEFPRDRHTQELFFIDARPRGGRSREAGDDIDDGDAGTGLPEPGLPDETPGVTA